MKKLLLSGFVGATLIYASSATTFMRIEKETNKNVHNLNLKDKYDVDSVGNVTFNRDSSIMYVNKDTGDVYKYDVDKVVKINFIPKDTMGHEYVDLGLSVLWAKYNMGATSIEDVGDYYAWGELETKPVYDWATYKFTVGDSQTRTKYKRERIPGETPDFSGIDLDPEDDAAAVNWGGEWRIPDMRMWDELLNECEWLTEHINGVWGFKVLAKNGNWIFLPETGSRVVDTLHVNEYDPNYRDVLYWSSTIFPSEIPFIATALSNFILPNGIDFGSGVGTQFVNRGIPIRPVIPVKYTVSFYTADSVLLDTQILEYGMAAAEVAAPVIEGVPFLGWSEPVTYITHDADVYAQYGNPDYTYVDLGLSVKWASANVGALSMEKTGDYFAWGETSPKDVYTDTNYKWCDKESYSFSKYYSQSGKSDSLIRILPEDDAATVNCGGKWRIPTVEEWRELQDRCDWKQTEMYGVLGHKITAENGNWIFLPAGDVSYGENTSKDENHGSYWTSVLYVDDNKMANYVNFKLNESWRPHLLQTKRGVGMTVRAVLPCEYKISYYTEDSVLITTQVVESGEYPKEVAAPEKKGYTFVGWGNAFDRITSDMNVYAQYTEGDHGYVDLGLSVMWATCNVGAESMLEPGDLIAWGEVSPKDNYADSTYKWGGDGYRKVTKYVASEVSGEIDSLLTLLPEDDAATVNWGDEWRMPTEEEWDELRENCYVEFRNVNGVAGHMITAKNGNWIFLPAVNYISEFNDSGKDEHGYYWSSSLRINVYYSDWAISETLGHSNYSGKGKDSAKGAMQRSWGMSVRPVRAK